MVAVVATQAEAGARVDAWVARRFEVSRSRAAAWLKAGALTLNGRPVKPSEPVRAGDVLAGSPPAAPAAAAEGEPGKVPVVHEDGHLAVVNKPAGLVVHPGAGRPGGTLVNRLVGMGMELAPAGGRLRPGIVHRLDKDTSGLLVVAKTDAAYWRLAAMAAAHELEREYLAIVEGTPRPRRGTISGAMARDPRQREKFTVVATGGRRAVTHYAVERELAGASLLRVTLETGRTHQIRVHLAAMGWPLLGDAVYGRRVTPAAAGRQALHAARLSFTHPVLGVRVACEAPLPDDLRALIRARA